MRQRERPECQTTDGQRNPHASKREGLTRLGRNARLRCASNTAIFGMPWRASAPSRGEGSPMTVTQTASPGWSILTHTAGEVLAIRAGTPGLELILLGRPTGFTSEEVEGWLRELLGVASEPRPDGVGGEPNAMPPLLH